MVNKFLTKPIFYLLLILSCGIGFATTVTVDLFLSSTCPHCQKAEAFFTDFEEENSWVKVQRHFVDKDKGALTSFYNELKAFNADNFYVPAMFFCQSHWKGFDANESSGKVLNKALHYCYQNLERQGNLTKGNIHLLQQWAEASQLFVNPPVQYSPLSIVLIMALADAFGPCAFFCFAIFLAFLWVTPESKLKLILNGLFFITCLGIVHWLHQVYPEILYQFFMLTRIASAFLGGVLFYFMLCFFTNKHKKLLSQWVIFSVIIVSAFLVELYQQSCLLNRSFVFQEWLTQTTNTSGNRLCYQLLFEVTYVLPLLLFLLMNALYTSKGIPLKRKLLSQYFAFSIFGFIGILLLIKPILLNRLWLSMVVLVASFGIGLYLTRGVNNGHNDLN